MRMSAILSFVSVLSVCAGAAHANPFVGTWKQDLTKLDVENAATTEIQEVADGSLRWISAGSDEVFKVDGKPHAWRQDPNTTITWRQLDDHTWESTQHVNGQPTVTMTMRVSPDQKTLTRTADGKNRDGEPFKNTSVSERIAGTNGIAGKWKPVKMSRSTPEVIRIEAAGQNGIRFQRSSTQSEYTATFDGSESPVQGPGTLGTTTVSLSRPDERTIKAIVKQDGKVSIVRIFAISPDGKQLVETTDPRIGSITYIKQ